MKKLTLQTESFLFEHEGKQFRAIPFYELSIDEWVIFENDTPKYLIDFGRRKTPLIRYLFKSMAKYERLEEKVKILGKRIGRNWTIHHHIPGDEIAGSQKAETVELVLLESLSDFSLDLMLIATDTIDTSVLFDDESLLTKFVIEYPDDLMGLEDFRLEGGEDLEAMLRLLLGSTFTFQEIAAENGKQIFDLTTYKTACFTLEMLDHKYREWIRLTGRKNTMDEYGTLLGIVGYIHRNMGKQHLLLIAKIRNEPV